MRGALLALVLVATPAKACDLRHLPWEAYAADVAIVGDVATTMDCLHRNVCHEGNPLYGTKHPTDRTLLAVGAGRIAVTTGIACFLEDRDPAAARLFSRISLGINGGIFAANLRFAL